MIHLHCSLWDLYITSHLHSNKNLHFFSQDRFIRIFPTLKMSVQKFFFSLLLFARCFCWQGKISGQSISLCSATGESLGRSCEEAPGGILSLCHFWAWSVARASPQLCGHTHRAALMSPSPNEPAQINPELGPRELLNSKGAGSDPPRSEINQRAKLCQARPWQGWVFCRMLEQHRVV